MLLKGMEFDTAHFITDVSGKYPRLWALKGAHPVTVNRWYKFGVLASIRTVAPGDPSTKKNGDTHQRSTAIYGKERQGQLHSSAIKEKLKAQKRISKIRESTHLSPSSLYYRVKIRAFAFGPLFLYPNIYEPKEYLRLKVENELRLCWVLLKEFRTTVSPAAVV
ncbi:hypothetical protein ACS0TY_017531 [Phlomoides rotata]